MQVDEVCSGSLMILLYVHVMTSFGHTSNMSKALYGLNPNNIHNYHHSPMFSTFNFDHIIMAGIHQSHRPHLGCLQPGCQQIQSSSCSVRIQLVQPPPRGPHPISSALSSESYFTRLLVVATEHVKDDAMFPATTYNSRRMQTQSPW